MAFEWNGLQKKRTYYKCTLKTPVVVSFPIPARQSHYEPEMYLLDQASYAAVEKAEKSLVKEMVRQNESWFRNALTAKQIEKRFSSACSLTDHSIVLDTETVSDKIHAIQLVGVRIFKNHWAPIWLYCDDESAEGDSGGGAGSGGGGGAGIDVDAGDLSEATQKLRSVVDETHEDIQETIRLLQEFSKEMEDAMVAVEGYGDGTGAGGGERGVLGWQHRVDEVYKKVSMYRSGIIMTKTSG